MLSKNSLLYLYAVLLIATFGLIDYWTGPDLVVTILYFLPIYLLVTRSGFRAGLIGSFLASAVDFFSDAFQQGNLHILGFNTVSRWIVFYGFCVLMTHRRQAELKLVNASRLQEQQIRFQKLITQLSTRFINIPCEFIDDAIHFALRQIGEFKNVDRCYVFLFSKDGVHMEFSHEWCARGIPPQISRFRKVKRADYTWAVGTLEKGEVVHIPSLAQLPPEAEAERIACETAGVRSTISVPLVCEGLTLGFMGFDSVREERTWTQDTIVLLRIVSDVFANALQRNEAQATLEQNESRYRELFECNPNPMWVFDQQSLAFLAVNDAAVHLLGYSRAEFLSMTIQDIRPASEIPKLLAHLRNLQDQSGPDTWTHKKKDDTTILVEVTGHDIIWNGAPARLVAVFDVTERNRAMDSLKESEEKFRSLVETTSDAIIISDASGAILSWNAAAAKMFGLDENSTGKPLFDLVPQRYRTPQKMGLARYLAKARSSAKGKTIEIKALRKDGTEFPVDLSVTSWQAGGSTFFAGIIRDITGRKAVEQALMASELKYRTLIENMSEGLIVADHDDFIMYVNDRFCEIFGYSVNELIGQQSHKKILTEKDWHIFLEKNRLRAQGISDRYEVQCRKKSGEPVWMEISGAPMHDPSGKIVGSIAIITDISERKQAEKELLEISTREQRRIGQDLHDGFGQHLTGLGFLCKALQQKLASRKAEEAFLSQQILDLVQQAMNQSQNLAKLIRPVPLDQGGLVQALTEMAANTQRIFQIDCQCSCGDPALRFDNLVEDHVYRIAQEAVNNAVKHAHPTQIDIRLITDNGNSSLIVRDNGSGIHCAPTDRKGFGLKIMQYRASMIGGKLEIHPHSEGGTIVRCMWPSSQVH